MKKNTFLFKAVVLALTGLVFCSHFALASRSTLIRPLDILKDEEPGIMQLSVTYSFGQPTLTAIQDGFFLVEIEGLSRYGEAGEPLLPYTGSYMFVPPGKTITGIEVYGVKLLVSGNASVFPAAEPVPISQRYTAQDPKPNLSIYNSSEAFPSNPVESVGTFGLRGAAIHVANICPVEFHPRANRLYYYPEMQVTFYLENDETGTYFESNYRGLAVDKELIMQKVHNPGDVQRFFDESPDHSLEVNKERYDLLIITTEELRSGFVPLARSHIRDGIRTTIRTLGRDIPVGVDYNDTCTKIRDYIQDAYQNWHIEYVLLGGDEDIVPARQLRFGYRDGRTIFGPSDMYYGCLDGCFDANGNGIYGEYPVDEVDFFAEVYVGRACVGDLGEVGNFINKTLWYKRNHALTTQNFLPVPSDDVPYAQRVLLVGEYLTGPLANKTLTFGGCYMDELIDGSDNNDYSTVGIPSDHYSIDTLYDRDWPGFNEYSPWVTGWPVEELITRINSGVHIINHLGHAGSYYNMKLDIYWDTSDIDAIQNDKYCFIYSQGCHAGGFDLDAASWRPDCIAEYLTVKMSHGAFAGIWNAREGWYRSGGTDGPSQRFNREFWNVVFGQGKSVISIAHQQSRENCVYKIDDNIIRWVYYGLNYLGDPTLTFRDLPLGADAHGPYEGLVNEPLSFSGSAYHGTHPYRWHWDFGDGNTSKEKNPVHTYSSYGLYHVTLTVIDARGRRSSDETTARIRSYQPVVWVNESYCEGCENDGLIWNQTAFNTIQEGVDAVADHGTVFVSQGTYHENIAISKTISVVGQHKETTIVDGGGYGTVFTVSADLVNISGFTIRNSGTAGSGIQVDHSYSSIFDTIITENNLNGILLTCSSNQNTITGNSISYNENGLVLECSSANIISNNIIMNNNMYGMWLSSSNSSAILGNTISHNGQAGILLCSSSQNSITGNSIVNNMGSGISIESFSTYNSITGNSITENSGTGIYLDSSSNHNSVSGNSICNNVFHGMSVSSSSHNSIIDNTIQHSMRGISLLHAHSNYISGNTIENTGYAIKLWYSSEDNIITGNTIQNNLYALSLSSLSNNNFLSSNYISTNWFGIMMDSSSHNIIFANSIINHEYYGVLLDYSSNHNSITGNVITDNNGDGIQLTCESNHNSIIGNFIAENHRYGVYLHNDATGNLISRNTVQQNHLAGIAFMLSSSNTLYHNNFMNAQNAYIDDMESVQNFWNHTDPLIGGNYWNDWEVNSGYPDYYFINEDNIDYNPFHEPNGWMQPS